MKKIFYLLASAIVALGAVACQNDINEAITPEEGSQISFKVSFDESTRVAMGALADGKLPFVFDGNGMKGGPDSLYVGYLRYNTLNERYYHFVKLVNSTEQPDTFTLCDSDNLTRLEQWVEEGATDIYAKTKGRDNTVSNQGASGLFFKSEQFKLVEGENQISLSLACPAFYFQVLEGVEVEFMVKDKDGKTLLWNEQSDKMPSLTFGEGVHIVGIDEWCSEAVISYSVDGVVLKEKALNNLAHKVYNLGTLGTDIATYNGVNYTNLHDALNVADGQEVTLLANATLAMAGTFKINTNGHTLTISSDYRMTDNGDGTITVVAIEWAVKVGEAKYEDFATAWATIQDGDVVTLMKDLTLTSAEAFTIPADKAITLDLGNKTLTLNDTVQGTAMIHNNGGLTIKNGTIVYSYAGEADNTYGKGNYAIWNNGALTIGQDVTIQNITSVTGHAHYVINADAGSTIVTSGNFTSTGTVIRMTPFRGVDANTLTINGGYISGTRNIQIHLTSNDATSKPEVNVTINNGIFNATEEGYNMAIYATSAGQSAENVTININGGTINGNVFVDATVGDTMQEGAVKVTGGTFTNVYNFYSYGDQQKADSSFSITGGIYTQYEPYYVDEGYVAVWNGNHYLVKEWIPVAKVGEVEYDNLGDAIEAADGEVIILVGDAVIAELGTFNIDLNGHNLTAAEGFTLTIDEENNTVTVVEQKPSIYLRPGAWNEEDGWFMAYFWGNGLTFVKFIKEGDKYVAEVPDGATGMLILQKSNDNDTLDWNGVLFQNGVSHQTRDINEINIGYTYTICSDGYGSWYTTCEKE